ncbi:uncharacterized [Tachysurus ichikawai]
MAFALQVPRFADSTAPDNSSSIRQSENRDDVVIMKAASVFQFFSTVTQMNEFRLPLLNLHFAPGVNEVMATGYSHAL